MIENDEGELSHGDFLIGLEFWCGGSQWRCTDVGTRTVTAIKLDPVELSRSENGTTTPFQLTRQQAETEGWFNGPPYAIAEMVFDEDDFPACTRARASESD